MQHSPFEIAPPAGAQPASSAAPPAAVPPPGYSQPPSHGQPASPFESAADPSPAQADSTPVYEPAPPQPVMGGFGGPPAATVDEEALNLPVGALEDPREFVEMNVVQLLGSLPPERLGLVELGVSPFATTRIPMAMLKPQLPTGQVFLNVSDVIVGCKPEHRASMVGCNPTVRIKVPIGLIFPAVGEAEPAPAAPAPAGSGQPDLFGGPAPSDGSLFGSQPAGPPRSEPNRFSEPKRFDANPGAAAPQNPPPSLGGPTPPQPAQDPRSFPAQGPPPPAKQAEMPAASSTGLSGFGGLAPLPNEPLAPTSDLPDEAAPKIPPPAPEVPTLFGSPLSALAPLGGAEPRRPADSPTQANPPLPPLMPVSGGLAPTELERPTPPPAAASPLPLFGAPPAESASSHESGGWPIDESKRGAQPAAGETIESLEDLPPVREDGDCVMPHGFGSMADHQDDPQSTLRGVFLTDGKIDAESVVAHCAGLPGIENCIVLAEEGILGGATSPESARFGERAAKLYNSLLELTEASGVTGGDALSVRADGAMVSFFAGQGIAIAVKHEARGFRPGVSERLAVVARELGKLSHSG